MDVSDPIGKVTIEDVIKYSRELLECPTLTDEQILTLIRHFGYTHLAGLAHKQPQSSNVREIRAPKFLSS